MGGHIQHLLFERRPAIADAAVTSTGMAEAQKVVERVLAWLLRGRLRQNGDASAVGGGWTTAESEARSTSSEAVRPSIREASWRTFPAVEAGEAAAAAAKAAGAGEQTPLPLAQCGLLNISVCGASVAATRAGKGAVHDLL